MSINTQEFNKKAIGLLIDGKAKFNGAKSKVELEDGYKTF